MRRAPCRRYGCFVTGLIVTGLISSQAFRTDPTQAWERDDMLKKVKKISLRVPFETGCLAVKAWQVFKRENYFRQYIFYFAGSIKPVDDLRFKWILLIQRTDSWVVSFSAP
jgi:hypothetical protein